MWHTVTSLPSMVELAAAAARCSVPCVLWCVDMGLTIRAVAGQLAPLSPYAEGRNVLEAIGTCETTDPSVNALRRAYLGEVVYYTAEASGMTWDACYAPIVDAKRVRGVIGQASRAETARGVDPEEPFVYRVTCDAFGFRVGERITRQRRKGGAIRRHDDVALEDFDHLLALGVLTPVPSVAAYEADARCAAPADGRAARLPRGFLRLMQGGQR